MIDVIIIGSDGTARECYFLFQDMMSAAPGLQQMYAFKGFLRWAQVPVDLKKLGSLLLGNAENYSLSGRELFIIGMAEPALRKAAYTAFKERGASFLTLVHPWAEVSPEAEIGEANIFHRGSTVFCDCLVGNANYFSAGMNLAHDAVVGDCNFIGHTSLVLGQGKLGNMNSLGAQSVLLPGAKLGSGNRIASGSIVYKGCGDGCLMEGNPALVVGRVPADIPADRPEETACFR